MPVQILAPEIDPQFSLEMKNFCNITIPKMGLAYSYEHFPGVEHSFALRGDLNDGKEREAMVRAKNVAVGWFRQWLTVE